MSIAEWMLAAWMLVSAEQSRWHLPVTIEVTRDVDVKSSEGRAGDSSGQLRGTLYGSKEFRIRRGERFQMVKIYTEGECRIRFKKREYDLSSCYWLDGFTDHQSDIFRIIRPR